MLFVLLSALAVIGQGDDLILLQLRAAKLDGSMSTGGSATWKTSEVFDAISAQMHAIEASVATAQQSQQTEFHELKVAYSQRLADQQRENKAVSSVIRGLTEEIAHLRDGNNNMRQHALDVQKANRELVGHLQSLQNNLTLAHEFIDDALVDDQNESELRILNELDDEDEARLASEAHTHRIDEITGAGNKHAALLEIMDSSDEDTKELLRSLEGRLGDLETEKAVSEAKLKEHFEEKLKLLTGRNAELTTERDRLEAVKASLNDLRARLFSAVRQVDQKHLELEKKVLSLKLFVQGIGDKSSNAGFSLLQVATPTDDSSVKLRDPATPAVVHNLSIQILALERTVELRQRETDDAIAQQKMAYERKLRSQHQNNSDEMERNAQLSQDISKLEDENTALQAEAAKISEFNERLREEIHGQQGNFTVATEFATRMLHELKNSSSSAALDVLSELREAAAKTETTSLHAQRLKNVASGSGTALLQQSAAVRKPHTTGPAQLAQLLEGNLEDMVVESSSRQAKLKQDFTEKFDAGEKKHQELMTEHARFESEKAAASNLRSSLTTAVKFLANEQVQLEEGARSLKAFSKRMGAEAKDVA